MQWKLKLFQNRKTTILVVDQKVLIRPFISSEEVNERKNIQNITKQFEIENK